MPQQKIEWPTRSGIWPDECRLDTAGPFELRIAPDEAQTDKRHILRSETPAAFHLWWPSGTATGEVYLVFTKENKLHSRMTLVAGDVATSERPNARNASGLKLFSANPDHLFDPSQEYVEFLENHDAPWAFEFRLGEYFRPDFLPLAFLSLPQDADDVDFVVAMHNASLPSINDISSAYDPTEVVEFRRMERIGMGGGQGQSVTCRAGESYVIGLNLSSSAICYCFEALFDFVKTAKSGDWVAKPIRITLYTEPDHQPLQDIVITLDVGGVESDAPMSIFMPINMDGGADCYIGHGEGRDHTQGGSASGPKIEYSLELLWQRSINYSEQERDTAPSTTVLAIDLGTSCAVGMKLSVKNNKVVPEILEFHTDQTRNWMQPSAGSVRKWHHGMDKDQILNELLRNRTELQFEFAATDDLHADYISVKDPKSVLLTAFEGDVSIANTAIALVDQSEGDGEIRLVGKKEFPRETLQTAIYQNLFTYPVLRHQEDNRNSDGGSALIVSSLPEAPLRHVERSFAKGAKNLALILQEDPSKQSASEKIPIKTVEPIIVSEAQATAMAALATLPPPNTERRLYIFDIGAGTIDITVLDQIDILPSGHAPNECQQNHHIPITRISQAVPCAGNHIDGLIAKDIKALVNSIKDSGVLSPLNMFEALQEDVITDEVKLCKEATSEELLSCGFILDCARNPKKDQMITLRETDFKEKIDINGLSFKRAQQRYILLPYSMLTHHQFFMEQIREILVPALCHAIQQTAKHKIKESFVLFGGRGSLYPPLCAAIAEGVRQKETAELSFRHFHRLLSDAKDIDNPVLELLAKQDEEKILKLGVVAGAAYVQSLGWRQKAFNPIKHGQRPCSGLDAHNFALIVGKLENDQKFESISAVKSLSYDFIKIKSKEAMFVACLPPGFARWLEESNAMQPNDMVSYVNTTMRYFITIPNNPEDAVSLKFDSDPHRERLALMDESNNTRTVSLSPIRPGADR